MKDLALDMDIVELLRLRRLTYFSHCTRMDPGRCHIFCCMVTRRCTIKRKPRKRWLDNVKETVPPYNSHFLTQTDWSKTDLVGGH